jgi:hypothetical protein
MVVATVVLPSFIPTRPISVQKVNLVARVKRGGKSGAAFSRAFTRTATGRVANAVMSAVVSRPARDRIAGYWAGVSAQLHRAPNLVSFVSRGPGNRGSSGWRGKVATRPGSIMPCQRVLGSAGFIRFLLDA